jgi:hypothetical protein
MNFFELAAVVIGNFFVAGIVAGFLFVAVQPRRGGRRHIDGGDGREPSPHRDDDERPPRRPGT